MIANAMTVDVEDWFHVLDAEAVAPPPDTWDSIPWRLERNMHRMLDIFTSANVKTTLFWLGWAAERFPSLVRRAVNEGHEIASHGQDHLLAYKVGRKAFARDIRVSKDVLEQIAGCAVLGFRVPGFSFTRQTPWAYDELAAAGYRYSSSVFPAERGHGGIVGAPTTQHTVESDHGDVVEFPITTVKLSALSLGPLALPSVGRLADKRICVFGGGYLRLAPQRLIRKAADHVNALGLPVIYYLHPREIDPRQPKMWRLPPARLFKYYVNLHTTERKLRSILSRGHFSPLAQRLA